MAVARDRARETAGGPRVAGIELAAGIVRAVVARAEGGRLRVVGRGETALAADAIAGGLVVEPGAVTSAVAAALAAAERGVPSDRTVIAIDGDDVRTYHVKTPFDREESGTPIVRAEADRAVREAREEAARVAQTAVADDPALRGVATARLTDDVAALVLDGRELDSVEGYHGRALEVHTDVAVAPLVLSGAALATVAVRRRPTAVPGIYALARLVAASGIADAGIVRVGADVTAPAIVALPLSSENAPPPERWLFVGVPESLLALPNALARIVGEARGGPARIGPLTPSVTSRVFSDVPLNAEDLVAAGAAALATEVYS